MRTTAQLHWFETRGNTAWYAATRSGYMFGKVTQANGKFRTWMLSEHGMFVPNDDDEFSTREDAEENLEKRVPADLLLREVEVSETEAPRVSGVGI